MKKLISFTVAFVFTLWAFIGCSDNKKYDYPFADIRWTRSGDSDTEFIRFSSNGEFSYYCACGNPVNDSDLCTGYTYNSQTKTITLKYIELTDEAVTKIKVIKCAENELILDFDGDIRTFEVDKESEIQDIINHNGKEYLLIEFTGDVFVYGIDSDGEYEEDVIYEMPHSKWDILCCNGELFAPEESLTDIISYYSDDDNYIWSVTLESIDSDEIIERQISLSDDEILFFEQLTDTELNETVLFDSIETFGTLIKTANDGLICGKTDLLRYNNRWYWRSETIDESTDGWPEYVVPLPESLNEKIENGQ